MVRGLPRSGAALQRDVRPPDSRSRKYSRGASRPGLHDVPFDLAGEKHHGAGGFSAGISGTTQNGGEQKSAGGAPARFSDGAESGAASPRVPEAVHAHADGGILLQLPQSAS